MTQPPRYLLDASALLAYLHDESGADVVDTALAGGALMSSVNWAEVLSRLVQETNGDADIIRRNLTNQGLLGGLLTLVSFIGDDSVVVARLRLTTKPYGLSFGDRACLATALRLGLPVLTADRVWGSISVDVPVKVIR